MRVLLVEDDEMIGRAVREGLEQDRLVVDWARDGEHARLALATSRHGYAVLLLDLAIPRLSGLDLLAELRRQGNAIPVLILTARDAVADRVMALNSGADDYLVKPFDLEELIARIHALARRGAGRAAAAIEYGPLRLDPITREASLRGRALDLSPREFALLHALLEPPGAVLSRGQLEERLYGWDREVASNAVDVHLHNLRKKLGGETIVNVRGVGFRVAKI
jgi:two-component system, OmpR family, response regulator QseB